LEEPGCEAGIGGRVWVGSWAIVLAWATVLTRLLKLGAYPEPGDRGS